MQRTFALKLRFLDFVVVILALGITVFYTVKIYGSNNTSLQLVIQGKSGSWVYPINQTVHVDIPGPLGNTTVVLKDGKAQVISSPCANQTCVTSGIVHRRGQWAACLPNAVFVRVESREPSATANDSTHGVPLDGAVW